MRSNDAVVLNFAETVLREAGIASMLADQHISVIEGSIGAFPRRLLVGNDNWEAACQALREAGLGTWLIREGEAPA